MKIGLASGNFHQLFKKEEDLFFFVNYYKKENLTEALELHIPNEEILDLLLLEEEDLSSFSFLSVHAPCFVYKRDQKTRNFLEKFEKLRDTYKIKNFIFHTDKENDWEVFKEYPGIPVSIENMDKRKGRGKDTKDIKKILEKHPFGLTLDLQHCFTNDKEMKLVEEFHKEFYERIVEYHLSGFDKKENHFPLYKTKQDIIVKHAKKDVPVIIESEFKVLGEEKKEISYIKKLLRNNF